jgi:hypothetical protein
MGLTIIDTTFGALFVGLQFSTLLYGISILQAWIFFQSPNKEPMVLRILVGTIMVIGLFLTIIMTHGIYFFLVSTIGNPALLSQIPWSLKAEAFVNSSIIVIVQAFYGFRLFYLNRSYTLLAIIMFLALGQWITGWTSAGFETTLSGTLVSADLTKKIASASIAGDLACDTVIMVSMFYFLHTHRTGVKSTETLMHKLVIYTLASGFLTFVGAAATLICYLAMPQNQIFSSIAFILPHLYSNALLAVLNSRQNLRDRCLSVNSTGPPSSMPVFKKTTITSTTESMSDQLALGTISRPHFISTTSQMGEYGKHDGVKVMDIERSHGSYDIPSQ